MCQGRNRYRRQNVPFGRERQGLGDIGNDTDFVELTLMLEYASDRACSDSHKIEGDIARVGEGFGSFSIEPRPETLQPRP